MVWHQGEVAGVQCGGGPACTGETHGHPAQGHFERFLKVDFF